MTSLRSYREFLRHQEGGFVIVLVSISMVAIVLIAGFAVDVGSWYLQASKLQRASDAASLAGAMKLPDTAAADAAAMQVYASNGFSGPSLSVTNSVVGDSYVSEASLTGTKAIFAKQVFNNIGIKRKSAANRPSELPVLGSPFNVLGVGNNAAAGVTEIPEQNFWLAVNGQCASKEDGDYFTSRYDNNKGPTTGTRTGNKYNYANNAQHACVGGQTTQVRGTANSAFDDAGYSYYVDIPKAAVSSGQTVSIKVFDMGYDDYESVAGDYNLAVGNPSSGGDPAGYVETLVRLWKVNEDAPDTEIITRNYGVYDRRPNAINGWSTLATFNNAQIPVEGGQYRVQIVPHNEWAAGGINESILNSINAFAIGAFRGNDTVGCDTREQDWCPNVYGKGAVSVYNLLPTSAGSTSEFYLADLSAMSANDTFDVYLWDPGEGVAKIDLVGPGDLQLPFRWTATASTNSGATASTGDVAWLDTDDTLADPVGLPKVSNNYVFNDRLVKLTVTLPPEWASLPGTDRWVSMRYYSNGTTDPDRTTWGVSVGGIEGAPPHLVFSP